MNLQHLIECKIIKRYKRFLADVVLPSGELCTVHCPNSGSMMDLITEGSLAYISKSTNPNNKLPYKLELIHDGYTLVGINTSLTNALAKEAFLNNKITELQDLQQILSEQKFNSSRLDFKIIKGNDNYFVEVKNVTLKRKNTIAEFPDAITSRGTKHLSDLILAQKTGYKALQLYIAQRDDVSSFRIAKDIDITYWEKAIEAKHAGVMFLAYSCNISPWAININRKLDIQLDEY